MAAAARRRCRHHGGSPAYPASIPVAPTTRSEVAGFCCHHRPDGIRRMPARSCCRCNRGSSIRPLWCFTASPRSWSPSPGRGCATSPCCCPARSICTSTTSISSASSATYACWHGHRGRNSLSHRARAKEQEIASRPGSIARPLLDTQCRARLYSIRRRDLVRQTTAIAKAHGLTPTFTEGGAHTKVTVGARRTVIPCHSEINEITARAILRHLDPGRK